MKLEGKSTSTKNRTKSQKKIDQNTPPQWRERKLFQKIGFFYH